MKGSNVRVDRWLWYARFFKSRTLASRLCASGRLRVNRAVIRKAHHQLRVGDVLTFPQGRAIRVVQVVELGERRGPANEARALYHYLSPSQLPGVAGAKEASSLPSAAGRREPGAGRPTKAERRAIDRLRGG